ncbi:phytanoyl-CoA dioxygenase family protein [Catellatospora sichuanensis]|uniref:phytanoyl-CoA dioxygenase family protein n=1 Tax=Catellatospora sichuanensis TaxID=1969805 RepID=UPI0011830C01|nr:phytanoyl-CoA dioxygenase family protein [Catellatospora sichuanensis]
MTAATSLADEFAAHGYVVLRGVLNADEVRTARALCKQHLAVAGVQEMMTCDFLANEFLAGIALRPLVLDTVAQLVGPQVVMYPNCTARMNVYVPWHVDTTFVGADTEYVWAPGFVHVQAGLYLQDNGPATGGGIDVIRGSHLMSFDGYGRIPADFSAASRTLGRSVLRETVDTRAGDMILWHGRLMHSSTEGHAAPEDEKFGAFFSYGRKELQENHRFLCRIARDSVRTMNGVSARIPRLTEIAAMTYPGSFPEWFVKQASAAGVEIVTLLP